MPGCWIAPTPRLSFVGMRKKTAVSTSRVAQPTPADRSSPKDHGPRREQVRDLIPDTGLMQLGVAHDDCLTFGPEVK